MAKVAADAARALAGIDPAIFRTVSAARLPKIDPAVVDVLSGFRTNAIASDLGGVRKAMESFESIAAPQIGAQLAATVGAIDRHQTESMAAIVKAMGPKPFDFAKAFETIRVSKLVSSQLPSAFESVAALGIPKSFGVEVADAIRAMPSIISPAIEATAEAAAEEAIVLAVDEDVIEDVDGALFARIADMSAKERRAVALDVLTLIGACIVLSAWLAQGELDDPRGAGIVLAWAASLIRLYWRLNDKV